MKKGKEVTHDFRVLRPRAALVDRAPMLAVGMDLRLDDHAPADRAWLRSTCPNGPFVTFNAVPWLRGDSRFARSHRRCLILADFLCGASQYWRSLGDARRAQGMQVGRK